MAHLFCNGEGMRGGSLHHNLSPHPFLGEVRTAPIYRFLSVRDRFPALELTSVDGASIAGELFDVPLADIRTHFLPDEPPELELTVVELVDGRSVLAVGLRPGLRQSLGDQLTDITKHGGWRAYRGLTAADSTPVPRD